VTNFTRHIDIGHEVHLYRLIAIAATSLAASSLDIEGKASRFVTTNFSLWEFYKQIADVAKHPSVGSRIGTRRAAYRTLIDIDYLVNIVDAVDAVIGHGLLE